MPLLLEEQGRHGAVHAPRNGHENLRHDRPILRGERGKVRPFSGALFALAMPGPFPQNDPLAVCHTPLADIANPDMSDKVHAMMIRVYHSDVKCLLINRRISP
jgi:hypothetical protein